MINVQAPDIPECLFRFRPDNREYFESELVEAIHKHMTYLSRVSHQNDPFDAFPVFEKSKPIELKSLVTSIQKKYGRNMTILGRSVDEVAAKGVSRRIVRRKYIDLSFPLGSIGRSHTSTREFYRLASFVENCESVLMWSHYANSHSGICLKYNVQGSDYPASLALHKVNYSDVRPHFSELECLRYIAANNLEDDEFMSFENRFDFSEKCDLTKSSEWSYEHEWRWVDRDSVEDGYKITLPMKVSAVILGVNCSEETRERCLQVVDGKVPVIQAHLSRTDYKIECDQ